MSRDMIKYFFEVDCIRREYYICIYDDSYIFNFFEIYFNLYRFLIFIEHCNKKLFSSVRKIHFSSALSFLSGTELKIETNKCVSISVSQYFLQIRQSFFLI